MLSKQELQERIRNQRSAVLLINTASRRARRSAARARFLLEEHGIVFDRIFELAEGTQLAPALEQALAMKPELLIAGGGDGTLSRCAAALAYRDTALGILPLGTTNNFARSLEIPLELTAAVEAIVSGKVADVDLGRANGRYFANVAGLGLSARVASHTDTRLKRLLGRTAYIVSGLCTLRTHRPFIAWLTTTAGRSTLTTHQVVVANGGFHGGAMIRGAGIDDRHLAVFRLGTERRTSFLRELAHFILQHRLPPASMSVNRIDITTVPAMPIELDGEPAGFTPLTIEVAAEALRIMVRPGFADT